MGLAYMSAPATTADAERAFSEGRNQVAWNQRVMSSQTFRAKMSFGAWATAPWFNYSIGENILASSTRPLRRSASSE
ncbi:hypothetical protein C8Q72DRAFT_436631 [Fomitopsis betulina]|nr:hypothetical protein C8Q72DRAFT_436631 [Fomitopsis betulina]